MMIIKLQMILFLKFVIRLLELKKKVYQIDKKENKIKTFKLILIRIKRPAKFYRLDFVSFLVFFFLCFLIRINFFCVCLVSLQYKSSHTLNL